jgi:hypothetical protein
MLRVAYCVAVFVCLVTSNALADTKELERETLKGLQGVGVVVEDPGFYASSAGLTISMLRTDVEPRLRQAGIAVLSEAERDSTPGWPYLYVAVTVGPLPSRLSGHVYSVEVQLHQQVTLVRVPTVKTRAVTWNTSSIGVADSPSETIRRSVRDAVDKFIHAYLAANPKR